MEKICAEMTIAQILKLHPDAQKILMRHGMYCIGCSIGESESLGDAAEMHQVSIDDLLRDLNKEQAA
ncbi:MAG: disulfide oxidoreductase [Candidatus Riflebacteria bacterium HGW-Riflebacteria-1]|jgi:hybrid cluster-associated redox disulfide protein|nr:MAG: disulfide oxidoreductase [Candidatus Riflebacteria bacterium HGW-Riflebacteria-1]